MTATIKAAPSPFAQAKTEFDSNPMRFLNEDLASVPVSGIPEEFRKLCRFLPTIVLVPKSAVSDKTTQKKPGPNKSFAGLTDTSDVCDTRIFSSIKQDLVRKERKEGHQ